MTSKTYLSCDALLNQINKDFGTGTAVRASDALSLTTARCSTGCTSLDILLGGGLVEGRIHQFRGNFSSTKSWTMLKTGLEYLTKYKQGVMVLVDAENTNDPRFLQMLGYTKKDLERVFIVSPNSGENAADIVLSVAANAEKCFIAIDSIDGLTPTAELESDMEKAGVSPGARMMNKFMRKLMPIMKTELLNKNPRITVLMICQLREKIGVLFGDSSVTWGGKGKEFAAHTIIKFSRTAWLRDGEGKTRITYGIRVQAEVIKSKGPSQGESTEYTLYKANFGMGRLGEFDNTQALLEWGVRSELIKKAGNKLTYGTISAVGDDKFVEAIHADDKTRAALLADIMNFRQAIYEDRITPEEAAKRLKRGKE